MSGSRLVSWNLQLIKLKQRYQEFMNQCWRRSHAKRYSQRQLRDRHAMDEREVKRRPVLGSSIIKLWETVRNQDVDCKRYEEVDGVRKEKERLTTDHQPPTVLQTRESILLSQAWSERTSKSRSQRFHHSLGSSLSCSSTIWSQRMNVYNLVAWIVFLFSICLIVG